MITVTIKRLAVLILALGTGSSHATEALNSVCERLISISKAKGDRLDLIQETRVGQLIVSALLPGDVIVPVSFTTKPTEVQFKRALIQLAVACHWLEEQNFKDTPVGVLRTGPTGGDQTPIALIYERTKDAHARLLTEISPFSTERLMLLLEEIWRNRSVNQNQPCASDQARLLRAGNQVMRLHAETMEKLAR